MIAGPRSWRRRSHGWAVGVRVALGGDVGLKIDSWFAAVLAAAILGVLRYYVGWDIWWILPSVLVGGFVCVLAIQLIGFLLMRNSARSRRLRILESNYGRSFGWY